MANATISVSGGIKSADFLVTVTLDYPIIDLANANIDIQAGLSNGITNVTYSVTGDEDLWTVAFDLPTSQEGSFDISLTGNVTRVFPGATPEAVLSNTITVTYDTTTEVQANIGGLVADSPPSGGGGIAGGAVGDVGGNITRQDVEYREGGQIKIPIVFGSNVVSPSKTIFKFEDNIIGGPISVDTRLSSVADDTDINYITVLTGTISNPVEGIIGDIFQYVSEEIGWIKKYNLTDLSSISTLGTIIGAGTSSQFDAASDTANNIIVVTDNILSGITEQHIVKDYLGLEAIVSASKGDIFQYVDSTNGWVNRWNLFSLGEYSDGIAGIEDYYIIGENSNYDLIIQIKKGSSGSFIYSLEGTVFKDSDWKSITTTDSLETRSFSYSNKEPNIEFDIPEQYIPGEKFDIVMISDIPITFNDPEEQFNHPDATILDQFDFSGADLGTPNIYRKLSDGDGSFSYNPQTPIDNFDDPNGESGWTVFHRTLIPSKFYLIRFSEVNQTATGFFDLTLKPGSVRGPTGKPASLDFYIPTPVQLKNYLESGNNNYLGDGNGNYLSTG